MNIRVVLLLLPMAAIGCDSPEASRTRGSGAGADVGNRPAGDVQMHGGSNQFWGTPDRIPAEGPPLEPGRHAQEFSRR
jgi:hypothetical protein